MANPTCCICSNEINLLPLSKIDCTHVSLKNKLITVVPEVHWNDSLLICFQCIDKLHMMLDFKAQCLLVKVEKLLVDAEIKSDSFSAHCSTRCKNLTGCTSSKQCNKGTQCKIHNVPISSHVHLLRYVGEIEQEDSPYNCVYYDLSDGEKRDVKVESRVESKENLNVSNTCKPDYEKRECSPSIFICFHCNKSFKSKAVLAKHIKVAHESKKYVCSTCGRRCKNKVSLKKHVQIHDVENEQIKKTKSYQCSKCEKTYKVEKVMKLHYETCDGIKRHSKLNFAKDFTKNKCEKCGRLYTTEKILRAHIKNCKGVKIEQVSNCYLCKALLSCDKDKLKHVSQEHGINLDVETTCQYCYKEFVALPELQLHVEEIHSNIIKRDKRKNYTERSYSCEVCSKIFGYVKEVIEHCSKEHEMDSKLVKPFLCDKCDTRFTSSANLIQHKQYHEGNRSHICSFCGKSYITKSDLTVHEYTHLNKRNYKCEFCDRAFNTNKNLRSHILVVHTNSSLWKYHCDECDKRFPLKSGYDQHIRRHAGDKRFQCLICEKSFVSSSELRKHMTFHSNVRAFKCSNCDKEYKDRRVYEIHLTKIHGIGNAKIPVRVKRHACHICPSKFFDKQKLARHLCTHTGIKPFPCTICDKRFADKSYLKNHLRVAHDIINTDEVKADV